MLAAAALLALLPSCASGSAVGSGSGGSQGGASSGGASPATSSAAAGSTSGAGPSQTRTTAARWPTYHRDGGRSGYAASGAPRAPLRKAWTADLDGQVYAEPLVVHGKVVAATEHNTVYGLDPASGAIAWKQHLGTPQPGSGLPCGNIDPLGITGTPAYDAATGSLFVVAETQGGTHTLWALDGRTGARRWSRHLDTQPTRNKLAEQQRGALLVTQGRVITPFGGLAGDCDNYVGYATSVPTSGTGSTTSYAVPTAREGGMWAPPGPVVGPNGHVYLASGNGAEVNGRWDKSDSVTELTPRLDPVSVFAPSSWAEDNRQDLDLGSSSPVPVAGRIVIAGKRGVVYLLPETFGGIDSQVAQRDGCAAYGGAARKGSDVVLPCKDGIRLLHVTSSALSFGWQLPGVAGSPVIVGGDVFATDADSGELVVVLSLILTSGSVRDRVAVGEVTRFATPTPYGGRLFVPTLSGITALAGS